MRTPIPRIYLGTMTFGWTSQTSLPVDEKVATVMVQKFIEYNNNANTNKDKMMMDTARVYAAGKTESIVGGVLQNVKDTNLSVGTKANPAGVDEGLSPEGIKAQLDMSLKAMQLSSVGEYYLHQPDTKHALLDSLKCVHELKEEGKITTLGMSNYHVLEMERAFALCKEHDLTPPTVYQGLYNPLNRMVEAELLPVLRANKCQFVAYNPLAAGLLTNKHFAGASVAEGRFHKNQNYLPRFYTDANFEALSIIQKACENEEITMIEATFRWLLRHSALSVDNGDGILLGASSVHQLQENLAACTAAAEKGPLSQQMLNAFEEAWKITNKAGPFKYWRSYSSDMPNRETMDQGASYTVKK